MAESDRHRLRERALELPLARESDFVKIRPPSGVDPDLLRRIDDTSLRTRLIDARLAEGLQSPKGPQRIASIVRIYPEFDAPPKAAAAKQVARKPASAAAPQALAGRLPTLEEMERLVSRVRELEHSVARELAEEIDARISSLKRSLADLDGDELEAAYRELGDALERRRALTAQTRFEVFRKIESDTGFSERTYLRFIRP